MTRHPARFALALLVALLVALAGAAACEPRADSAVLTPGAQNVATQLSVIVDRDPKHWGGVYDDDEQQLTVGVYGRSLPEATAILAKAGITGGVRIVMAPVSVAQLQLAVDRITRDVLPHFPGAIQSYGPQYPDGAITVDLLRDTWQIRVAIVKSVGPGIPVEF